MLRPLDLRLNVTQVHVREVVPREKDKLQVWGDLALFLKGADTLGCRDARQNWHVVVQND